MICKTKNSKEVVIFTLSFSHFFIPAQRISFPHSFIFSFQRSAFPLIFRPHMGILGGVMPVFLTLHSHYSCFSSPFLIPNYHLSFIAAHVIPSLISLHGAPCIIITLCPAGKLRFTVYRNYGCWCGVLASSLPASH